MEIGIDGKKRCFGGSKVERELYAKYHDEEWGVPVYDDHMLFEMLILEGAHAGLSWEIVLKKREGYRQAFKNFDVHQVAIMTDLELENLMLNPNIIRNRLKIFSARKNAIVFIGIVKEFGSFSKYLWAYVNNEPIALHFKSFDEAPTTSTQSDLLSKNLKKRGMNFVGSTIIFSYMQAVGMYDCHLTECWLKNK